MFDYISEKITNQLIRKEVIIYAERDIYKYGLEQLFMTVLNLATTVFLGILYGQLWQGLLFVAAFMAIRSYAGGYHAATPVRCYLLTTLIITAVLSVIKYVKIDIFICLLLLAASGVIILSLSPVESENKPLDNMEKMIYRTKTIVSWCVETFAAVISVLLKYEGIAVCIMMAELIIGLSLISGTIHLRKCKIYDSKSGGKK
ncbi:MAG: accessory gene regulator B family protein [Lachnospiraceae bacterium]|nr:accessory gene regulator B family protein [Lachnospiraceae bacterium]